MNKFLQYGPKNPPNVCNETTKRIGREYRQKCAELRKRQVYSSLEDLRMDLIDIIYLVDEHPNAENFIRDYRYKQIDKFLLFLKIRTCQNLNFYVKKYLKPTELKKVRVERYLDMLKDVYIIQYYIEDYSLGFCKIKFSETSLPNDHIDYTFTHEFMGEWCHSEFLQRVIVDHFKLYLGYYFSSEKEKEKPMTKEQIASMIDHAMGDVVNPTNPSTLKSFEEYDSYNSQNYVKGFLCHQSDRRYGCLVITHVNGEAAPQVIFCTPKLKYPFSRQMLEDKRDYKFPELRKAYAYDKLDGTNICAFSYVDHQNRRYTSYKTRLTPFLKNNRFVNAKLLWDEILEKYPDISDLGPLQQGTHNFSFELYGTKNPITIVYDVPIEAKLLFGICQKTVRPVIPEEFPKLSSKSWALRPSFVLPFKRRGEIVSFYESLRDDAEKLNVKTEDDKILGIEGYILYLEVKAGYFELYKCKPPSIETKHWGNGSIPLEVIVATTWNALESCDELTEEYIVELLAEEFSKENIEKSQTRIQKAIEKVLSDLEWRERVFKVYSSIEIPWSPEKKADILRAMSPFFSKYEMKKVYSTLASLESNPDVETG